MTDHRSDPPTGPEPGTGPHETADRPSGEPYHRRGFLRRVVGAGGVTMAGSLAGCARGGDAIDDLGGSNGGDGSVASPAAELRTGLEIGLGPTALVGLAGPTEIDPDEPGGGRLVTVETVEPGNEVTVSWRRNRRTRAYPRDTHHGRRG